MNDQNTNKPAWPEWAPPAAIEAIFKSPCIYGSADPRQDLHGGAMVRLLTYDEARPGWEAIIKKSERLGRDVDCDLRLIALSCVIAYCGPTTSTERMAPSARERWKQDVKIKARELADLVRDSGFDREMRVFELERFFCLREAALLDANAVKQVDGRSIFLSAFVAGVRGEPIAPDVHPPRDPDAFISLTDFLDASLRLSDFLEYVAESTCSMSDQRDLVMGAPNAPKARRAYFLRHLTNDLMKLYGDRDPMRPTVLSFARAAFDEDIDGSQLSRLVPVTR